MNTTVSPGQKADEPPDKAILGAASTVTRTIELETEHETPLNIEVEIL